MKKYEQLAASLLLALDNPSTYVFNLKIAEEVLTQARNEYYNDDGQSFLSDEDYDRLERALVLRDPAAEEKIAKGSMERGGKIKLAYPMPGLTQMHQDGDVESWVTEHHLKSKSVTITNKLDGTSAEIIYDKLGKLQIAYSRGDDENGADITRHISKIKNCPQVVATPNLAVRAECVMDKESFEYLRDVVGLRTRGGKPYKTARNMVAGCMNSKTNPDVVYEHIKVIAYSVLNTSETFTTLDKSYVLEQVLKTQNKFDITPYTVVPGNKLNDAFLEKEIASRMATSNYAIDGIVVEFEAGKDRAGWIDGSSSEPEHARKFKLSGDILNTGISECTHVEWRLTKDKVLQPRPHYKPIMINGVECTHATGYNAKFIMENKIGPGALLKIERCGDVVPNIRGVIKPADEPQMPDPAVFGDFDWIWNSGLGCFGVDLVAMGADGHEDVILRNLIHCFTTLNAPYLKEGNLKKLMDFGYDTPEKIITMSEDAFEQVLGSNGLKAFDELPKILHPISLPLLAKASCMFGRGIGERKMKKVYDKYGRLHNLSISELCAVESIEEATAQKIYDNSDRFYDWYTSLEEKGYITVEKPIVKGTGFSDQVVVFTGVRSEELSKAIELNGGRIGSSVSSKTTILVAKDPNSSSGKMKKARELQQQTGLKIIGLEELSQMVQQGTCD